MKYETSQFDRILGPIDPEITIYLVNILNSNHLPKDTTLTCDRCACSRVTVFEERDNEPNFPILQFFSTEMSPTFFQVLNYISCHDFTTKSHGNTSTSQFEKMKLFAACPFQIPLF